MIDGVRFSTFVKKVKIVVYVMEIFLLIDIDRFFSKISNNMSL